VEEGAHLLGLRDGALSALIATADAVRREDVGDVVTYVVNRNVNWTNICFVGCKFCAFRTLQVRSRGLQHSDGARAREDRRRDRPRRDRSLHAGRDQSRDARRGLLRHPRGSEDRVPADPRARLLADGDPLRLAPRRHELPRLHRTAHGSRHRQHPGTAAEILDDDVREILSHKKLAVAQWIEIITRRTRSACPPLPR
jgi:hypothetical protein